MSPTVPPGPLAAFQVDRLLVSCYCHKQLIVLPVYYLYLFQFSPNCLILLLIAVILLALFPILLLLSPRPPRVFFSSSSSSYFSISLSSYLLLGHPYPPCSSRPPVEPIPRCHLKFERFQLWFIWELLVQTMANATDYRRLVEKFCETVFPLQATLGIGGNLLTLLVLLSRPMRSRTNIMLACAAISDILFLSAMVPHNLARKYNWLFEPCEVPTENGTVVKVCQTDFRIFYIQYKTFFTFLSNWFSGSSTWLMVAVSFDRLWAIKSPFSTRTSSFSLRDCVTIPCIFVFTALLTMYMNFSFAVQGDTQKGTQRMVATQNSTMFIVFTLINLFFQVLLPMTLLILFNGFLLYYLKSRRQFLESATSRDERKSSDEMPPLLENSSQNQRKTTAVTRNGSNNSGSGAWTKQLCRAERHVTITVAAIVSVFVLTHLPSAILYANMYIFNLNSYLTDPSYYTWTVLSSTVVITGKVANFFLFCMSSRHFRTQMKAKLCCFFGYRYLFYKNSTNQRTRSLPLNLIGDSASNIPMT